MKRLLVSLFLLAALAAGSLCVCAEEEVHTAPKAPLPQTYIAPQRAMFSLSSDADIAEVLTSAWEKLDSKLDLYSYRIPKEDFSEIYWRVLYDNPLYYYVSNTTYGYSVKNGYISKLYPEYTETDKRVIEETVAGLHRATEEILLHISEDMTDFEKVMTVHDYMVLHYEYDETYSNYTISIMTTKTGVCMSYAFAFNHLMNELGIESTFVSSDAMNHAWNLVKVDGEWYHIDLTADDPIHDSFAQVQHTYALLSTRAIRTDHYGFDLGGLVADSTKYDNADWRDSTAAITFCGGRSYRVKDGDLVDEEGTVIFRDLDGGDGRWRISDRYNFQDWVFAGLAAYNGTLYFNTDTAIYSYDPDTREIKLLKEEPYVCGLFVDGNRLRYGKYNLSTYLFYDAGSIPLGEVSFGTPSFEGEKLVTRVYKEDDTPMMILSFGSSGCQMEEITADGVSTVTFDAEDTQTIFFWDEEMHPLREKMVVRR